MKIKSILIILSIIALILTTAELSHATENKNECETGSSGGITMPVEDCKPIKTARLIRGKAIAPVSAPAKVKKVIAWANKIRNKKYLWGGGHKGWKIDRGYDCSGAVSFALRGGRFLKTPLASPAMINWAKSGVGKWITVYANRNHAYMVVAGLRFDTANTPGNGPRWSKNLESRAGEFSASHPAKY